MTEQPGSTIDDPRRPTNADAAGAGASIIIVTYNGHPYLQTCLASVERELAAGDQLIVVDNGSADGGPELIEALFPRVVLMRNAGNRGFAAACNQGARLANRPILAFLNQDTEVCPGWREALVRALDGAGDVGLVTSQVRLMAEPDRLHLCGQDVHYTGLVFGRGYGEPAASQDLPVDVNAVSGASFAIRRTLWDALGGFDETFYMYYEETDLSWRAQLAGCRCCYIPASRVLHDYRPSRPSANRLYCTSRNRVVMLLKNWRWPTLVVLAPALLLAELLDWGLALQHGRQGIGAKFRAYAWIAAHLPEIRRARASSQKARLVSDADMLDILSTEVHPQMEGRGVIVPLMVGAVNAFFGLNHTVATALLRVFRVDFRAPAPGECR